MEIELEEQEIQESVVKIGTSSSDMVQNEQLKIKFGDETKLKIDVPSGKKWFVSLHLKITETDA